MGRSECSFTVTLLDVQNQVVTLQLNGKESTLVCSAVYANPSPAGRDRLWQRLVQLRSSFMFPWLVIGDFNEVAFLSKVKGGTFCIQRAQRFRDMMEECDLLDVGSFGGRFTWFRKTQTGQSISKKLDRAICSVGWRHMLQEAVVEVLPPVHSDHSPLLLHCQGFKMSMENRPFRFMASWSTHPAF